MKEINVSVSAYNVEDTIVNTIESVLNQTFSDFYFWITDNGSTDSTWDIIKAYMKQDDRIIAIKREKNYAGSYIRAVYAYADDLRENMSKNIDYMEHSRKFYDIDWLCSIDADDTYEPTFLEDMLNFARANELDVAICGWDFVRTNDVERRIPGKDLIFEKEHYADNLPIYDKFMGPGWNKMVHRRLFNNHLDYYEQKFAKLHSDGVFFYGADTCFTYIVLSKVDKFGILNKSLYKYNIHEASVSRKNFHPMRIVADRRLAQCRFDFLNELGSGISEENRKFILDIYYKSTMTTLKLLLDSNKGLEEKMINLYKMFNCELMYEAIGRNIISKNPLFY